MNLDPDSSPVFLTDAEVAELVFVGTVYGLYDRRYPDRVRYIGKTQRGLDTRLREHVSKPYPRMATWLAEMHEEPPEDGVRGGPVIRSLRDDVPVDELLRVEQEEIARHLRAGSDLLNRTIAPSGQKAQLQGIFERAGITAEDIAYFRAHPSRYVVMLQFRRAVRKRAGQLLRRESPREEQEAFTEMIAWRRDGVRERQRVSEDRGYVNAAGDRVGPGDFDPFEGCDPDEDPELWG